MDAPRDEAPAKARIGAKSTLVKSRFHRFMIRMSGPVLIIASVLSVLHGFWLHGRLTNQHVDLLAFWLPRWCFLGDAIAGGHLPTWLPHQFAGVPFASDPQSGWLYATAMLPFSVLPCARALGVFVTLQPIIAGLGLYLFFRQEDVGRPAATVGGLTLALTMAGSSIALSLPFAGVLAWTSVALAGVAGYLRAGTFAARLWWCALAAFAWSQLAAAHLTDGVLMGTAVLLTYFIARSVVLVRAGQKTARTAVLMGGALALAVPLLAAAVLVPRLALIPRISIGHGYLDLARQAAELSGAPAPATLHTHGLGPWWGTSFARGPGGYVGALAILLLIVAVGSRRWRLPSAAFALVGAMGYALNLDAIVGSPTIRTWVLEHRIGELWLRDPGRFKYLVVIALAALAGYGLQAWLDMGRVRGMADSVGRTAWMATPVLVFLVLPLAAGSRLEAYVPFLLGAAYAVPLLVLAARGAPRWSEIALPALLAVELSVVGLVAQAGPLPGPPTDVFPPPRSEGLEHSFPKFHSPFIEPDEYLTTGAIGRTLSRERDENLRYLTHDPAVTRTGPRGFLLHQQRGDWAAYENGRSILFDLAEIQGYSPVQLERYWRLVRRANRRPVFYNMSAFQTVQPAILRLFGVGWLIQPSDSPPPARASLAAREGRYSLYRLRGRAPRASMLFRWVKVRPWWGLSRVLRADFDPSSEGVVETTPTVDGAPLPRSRDASARVVYRELSAGHAQVRVQTTSPGLLLVRNAFDPNWRASVDGRPARVLLMDYVMQGVAVPRGRHTVELTYVDPAIGVGLGVSALAWVLLCGVLAWQIAKRRRYRRIGNPPAVSRPASLAVADTPR